MRDQHPPDGAQDRIQAEECLVRQTDKGEGRPSEMLEGQACRRGEVLPRSLIASQVWDMNFDSDTNVIEVAIKRLRVKIDDGFEPKLIRTVRGMGYVLEITD